MATRSRALAQHYGLAEEELDFIISYDIKYRMGQEADEGNERPRNASLED